MRWLILAVVAGSTLASKLTPPVLPLIVRNPYLSTWLGDARQPPWHEWPMFWTGERVRSHSRLLVDKLAACASEGWMADRINLPDRLFHHGLSARI